MTSIFLEYKLGENKKKSQNYNYPAVSDTLNGGLQSYQIDLQYIFLKLLLRCNFSYLYMHIFY